MADLITFSDANGAETRGALALPPGDGPAPALVLVQEWWGVNGHIRAMADRFAAQGFVVLAPDLYNGVIATDAARASELMNALQWPAALGQIGGALQFLKTHPRSNGHVGITGFCMGGAATLLAANNIPGFEAATAFYGLPPAAFVDWTKPNLPPLQAHFSATDPWAKPDLAAAARDTVNAHGGRFELHVYDAEHAFVNDTRPEVHHPEHAKTALERTWSFLHAHLG